MVEKHGQLRSALHPSAICHMGSVLCGFLRANLFALLPMLGQYLVAVAMAFCTTTWSS